MSTSVDVELLLDRLLSASTPSDCISSLEQLQKQCRLQQSNSGQSQGDPKEKRPSQFQAAEEERQRLAIDTILASSAALNALCSLVAQSTLPSQHDSSSKMEVEGGDVAACELLLEVLPSPPISNNDTINANKKTSSSSGTTTTEQLQTQRQLKRRTESIAKTLLHFHETDNTKNNAMDDRTPSSSLALIPSLLDCLCASSSLQTTSTYARVLSLQILQSFLSASPGALREQLMKAPDGINRLVDLLGHGSITGGGESEESFVPEEVRNEAILFLTSLASSSSVLARLITFSEGYDRALKIALGSRGSGLSIAMDCLELCLALAHADEVSRELFLGGGDGRGNLDRLGQLVDLRRGERFRSKEKNLWWENELKQKEKEFTKADNSTENKSEKKSGGGKGSKRGKQRKDDDDLDDILRGAGATTTSSSAVTSADKPKEDAPELKADKSIEVEGPPTPYLTPNETAIVDRVFNLVLVLLYDGEYSKSEVSHKLSLTDGSRSKRRNRAKTIVSHDILSRSIVDCAMYTLPPPGVDYVSAVPSPDLQQKALTTMAVLGSIGDTTDSVHSQEDEALRMKEVKEETAVQTQLLFETMPLYLYGRVTAMERLMYLCCTGAYIPKPGGNDDGENSPEAIASNLSINAISTFCSCLPSETASRMVLHALAPPPPEEADETGAPLDLPVVSKIVTTLAENLRFLQTQQQDDTDLDMAQICRASIGAAGSAGVLGVFLSKGDGDTNREMLLRLPPPPVFDSEGSEISDATTLIDFILQHVARYELPSKSEIQPGNARLHASNAFVTVSLLKLLCEWVFEMPKAVSQVLSSPSSVSLGLLIRSKKSSQDKKDGLMAIPSIAESVPALSGLLLGLCLEYMVETELASATAGENSAWTRETIMSLIQSMGVGKYLTLIDEWKTKSLPMPYWPGEKRSTIERRSFSIWYSHSVTLIRRRIVMTLAGSGDDNDSDSETEDDSTNTKAARSLKKMIKSQVEQIEELQAKLEDSLVTISTQTTQINDLKRISEIGTSAETNDVLSEYAEKVSELEKEKLELVNESKRIEKLHEEAVAAKDNEIDEIKEGLRQSETYLTEMRQERDTLSEEVAGLSSAYNLLETEYRSGSSGGQSEMTAGGETPAEDGDRKSSMDQRVKNLQEENARLSADVRAANEWMAMAVSRMNEMEAENESLQSQGHASNADSSGEMDSLRQELSRVRQESEAFKLESETALAAKDDELARSQTLVQELEAKIEEPPETGDNSLQSTVDKLQEQNASLTAERDGLQSNLNDFQQWADTAQSRIAEIEAELSKVTEERDGLNGRLQEMESSAMAAEQNSEANETESVNLKEQVAALTLERDNLRSQLNESSSEGEEPKSMNEESQVMIGKLQEQNASLTAERDGLQSNLNDFQQWADTAQSRIAEIEAELSKVTHERDAVQASLEEMKALPATDSFVIEQSEELMRKDEEINSLRTQLEQTQGQLNEGAEVDANVLNELRSDLEDERQRIADLLEKDDKSQALLNELNAEKEELLSTISKKQTDIDSNTSDEVFTEPLLSEAKRRIAELEEASKIATNEIIAITAERKELQSQLDDASEKCKQATKSVDDMKMEVDNFAARNRALEQDNKSLEQQFAEASDKCKYATELEHELKEKDGLLATAYSDLEALQKNVGELNRNSGDVVQQWKERAEQLEETISSLEGQMELQEQEAAEAISQWEARCSTLEADGKDVVQQWEERAQALEADIVSLEMQLAEKETEATEAISQWEARYSSLEDDGRGVIQQWEERAQALEADIVSLEMQLEEKESEATEAISQWEARCSDLDSSLKLKDDENAILVENNKRTEESNDAQVLRLADLENQRSSQAAEIQRLNEQVNERDETILSYTEQVKELADELVETRDQSEQVVQQWQERTDQLETNITELEETMAEQQNSATEAISQWEERCSALHEQIQGLELQLNDTTRFDELETALADSNQQIDRIKAELSRIKSELETVLSEKEELQNRCDEAKELLAVKEEEVKVVELLKGEINRLKSALTGLESDKLKLEHEKHDTDKENNDSKALIFELQEEVRNAKEELQSVVTDQFSAKATEIATHALRQQMTEIRTQYSVDQETLALEKDARAAAEDEVVRLKSDLALLAQATEYDDDADVHVRKVAKKIAAENVLKERKEMEELRSALDRLKEELGSCRWREREAEEKATNARLQMSILEQEVSAARADITLMEQALDELENGKIELTVSHEYRIETLENERISVGNAYEEEINALKAELAQTHQEKDSLAHKLDQSERANTALVYSTTHDGASGEESESEVVRLQLERAQLLAKINELGTNLERRVSEAVAAHAANAETELIMEKQRRNSVETSLTDALSKINEMKAQMSSSPKAFDEELSSYKRLLGRARSENEELREDIQLLQSKIDTSSDSSTSLVADLRDKLRRTEERLRSVEREGRFEAAMASEIANLRAGTQPSSNGSDKKSLVLRGLDQNISVDGNGSTAPNSAYIIEMYDYVVELKQSIEEERQMYKELVTEHEDLLALLGQAGLDGRIYAGE